MKLFLVAGLASLLVAGAADAATRRTHTRTAGAAASTAASRTPNVASLDGGFGGGALAGTTLRTDVPKGGGSDLGLGGKRSRGGDLSGLGGGKHGGSGGASGLGGGRAHKKSGGL